MRRPASVVSSSILRAVASLCLLSASSACVSTAQGDQLRADIDALKTETAGLQREVTDLKAGQKGRLVQMEARVKELESTLATLRQADADAGVSLEKVVAEVQALRGEIDEAKHELGEAKASVESILARPPVAVAAAASAPKLEDDPKKPTMIDGVEVPAEPKPHYDLAKKLFDDKKFAEAAEAFDLFLQRHASQTDLVDNAAYWKGESYYQLAGATKDKGAREKAFKQAILSYQRVLESADSEKADGALLKCGLSFEQLGFKDEARVFYEEIQSKHPKSPLVAEAKKRLKALGETKKKGK